MKLSSVLSTVNQIEKSKYLTFIEKIIDEAKKDNDFNKENKALDLQIKSATSKEIAEIFKLIFSEYSSKVKEELDLSSIQVLLLVNILSRDGNNIARVSWIEELYRKELEKINTLTEDIKKYLNTEPEDELEFGIHRKINLYYSCVYEAYHNDSRYNRERRISSDERSILNVLASNLSLSDELRAAIENSVVAIPAIGISDSLEILREIGIVFISRREQLVYTPNEMVEVLHSYKNKEIADKYILRILRTLSDSELSNILKSNDKRIRNVLREEKIREVINSGLSIKNIFYSDMHNPELTVNDRKERLKKLIEDLDLDIDRIGNTIEERTKIILDTLRNSSEKEFNSLSASGYKEMFSSLCQIFPEIKEKIGLDFELDQNDVDELNVEKLRALGVTPYDLVYLFNRDEIKLVREKFGVSNRGNVRLSIIEKFANETDKLVESYELLATRDLEALKNNGLMVAEADLGVKFEEATKSILEQLDLDIDEELRRTVNDAKNKADIVISIGSDDIIICEVKSHKNGDFAKYAATSRQIKSYVSHYEKQGKRVAQVLIIAPSFSDDFIASSGMDTDVNISLLEAKGLKDILNAFKSKKNPKFSANLLAKGGLLKTDLIAKNI